MSAAAESVSLWGRILLHNHLLTQAQWNECFRAVVESNYNLAIEDVIVEKGYLQKDHVPVIREKINALIAKHAHAHPKKHDAGDEDAAAVTAEQVQVVDNSGHAAGYGRDADEHANDHADDDDDVADASSLEAIDDDDEDDDDGASIELANADATDERVAEEASHHADETSWAADTSKVDAADVHRKHIPAEQVDLVDEEEVEKAHRTLKTERDIGTLKSHQRKPAAAARTHASEPVPDDHPRIASPVPPLTLDPMAMAVLGKAKQLGASDVHLSSGVSPFMRLHGDLRFFESEPLKDGHAERIAMGFMNDAQQQTFLRTKDLDFAFEAEGLGRMRVNALREFRGASIIFRLIPEHIPTLEELNLPDYLGRFTEWQQGLVLVTGPTGCGKSTTAAAMVNLVNLNRKDHVITVEDPVEYIHESKGCNVTQRQVPTHTLSFATALRAALREDPDVIMIGDMRDLETISLAIRAAETGHLVIGTLQTKSAARTVDRIIDAFPSDQQAQIRTMLSESLRAIVCQQLITRIDGEGRIPAIEVLVITKAVSNLIRQGQTFQIPSAMQTGRKIGQRLMDNSIQDLLNDKKISKEDAAKAAFNPKAFK